MNLFGQEKVVTGIIRDNTGDYIAGARIRIKGTKTETISSFDGSYSIKVKEGELLVFLWFSCKDIEMKVGNSNIINIRFQQEEFKLCDIGMSQFLNNEDLKNNYTPKFYSIKKDKTTTFDLENNFKNDVKNKSLKIYILDEKSEGISENQFNFQNKYKLEFLTFDIKNQEYFENYNNKLFNFLEDNYNDKWQKEISNDVLGFEKWQDY